MKNNLLRINGDEVLIYDLAQAWLSKATQFTSGPWSSPAPNLSPEDFAKVSLVDLNPPGKDKVKSLIKLPIRSRPGGPVNINALRSAGSLINNVKAPGDIVSRAARSLVRLMREAGIEPNPAVLETAGMGKSVQKDWEFDIVEKQEDKQLAFGIILRPGVADQQGDIITANEVENAAIKYMAEQAGMADWQHEKIIDREDAVLVQSFISPVDFDWNGVTVKSGDWLGGMWVKNKNMWEAIKTGEIRAFSIRGLGRRRELE